MSPEPEPSTASGTYTFLFTDLEGSTRLWEQYPEAMKGALARHDALLRFMFYGFKIILIAFKHTVWYLYGNTCHDHHTPCEYRQLVLYTSVFCQVKSRKLWGQMCKNNNVSRKQAIPGKTKKAIFGESKKGRFPLRKTAFWLNGA